MLLGCQECTNDKDCTDNELYVRRYGVYGVSGVSGVDRETVD
jgi:hypothetical protein